MKKVSRKTRTVDELRPEYKRSDFGVLVRGKYAKRLAEATNVVVLDARVAKAFPNDPAVNDALRGVLQQRKASNRRRSAARPARRRAR